MKILELSNVMISNIFTKPWVKLSRNSSNSYIVDNVYNIKKYTYNMNGIVNYSIIY